MSIKKLSFFSFLLLTFLFSLFYAFKNEVLANTVLFHDDFEDDNADGWTEINGTGGWEVINKTYVGTVTLIRPEQPAFSFAGNFEWENYQFEFDVKSISGVDKAAIFRYQDMSNFYIVNIRSMSQIAGGNDIVFQKITNSQAKIEAWIPFINYENTWYRVKIMLEGPHIQIFVDNDLKIDYLESENVLKNGKIGLIVWPGGHTHGEGDITTLAYDNIVVASSQNSNHIEPIILLPGLGASWNHEAMILGVYKEQEKWHMTPFVKNYDGLIQTLKNAGYETTGNNKNLYIFHYDWRQPIETIANQFDVYIENIVSPLDDINIDIIGHSLGGKVARTYVQNNPNHKIDHLITLGSPHKGAPQIYYLWEGADLKRTLQPWQRIGVGILLQLNKRNFQNNVKTIRSIVPGLKNLLPTFPYLKQNGVEKPLSAMKERNNWLDDLNRLPLPEFLTSVLYNFVGIKGDTLRWINIKDRNKIDEFFERWDDGKPIGEEWEMGDGSVLAESAQLSGATVTELSDLDHGDLVESIKGQQTIVNLLNISPSEIVPAPEIVYEPSLIFQIASSANITIFNPSGSIIAESEKLVFVPNPDEGEYQIHVNQESGGGQFRILIGKIFTDNEIWQEFEGHTSDEPRIYSIHFSKNIVKNKLDLLKLAKQKLELIGKKLMNSKNPFKSLIISTAIKWRISQIDKSINFLKNGKKNRAQTQIKKIIIGLIFVEKTFKFWSRFYPFELMEDIQNDLRLALDYLLQAYELE